MGAARRLQAEIDRTLKKVHEGMNEFDQIWEKVYDTDNQNQREKYEADLKKEIKKLQRLRDQIKTWIASSDIKDKTSLVEARKNIEREMERFKVCEKEAKTKAFSKAALCQAAKLDPEEKAKQQARDWLNEQVEALQIQIDEFECELEGLATGGKKNKKPNQRQQHLDESVERHKAHILRLEQVMRCLDNETVSAEDVEEIKEMVEWYVAENQDMPETFECVDDTYAELLDQLDAADVGLPQPAVKAKKTVHKEVEDSEERERERAAAAALRAQLAGHSSSNLGPAEEEKKPIGRTLSITATAGQNSQANSTTNSASPTAASKKKVAFAEGSTPATVPAVENDTVPASNPENATQGAANPSPAIAKTDSGAAANSVSFAVIAGGRTTAPGPQAGTNQRQTPAEGLSGDGVFPLLNSASETQDATGESKLLSRIQGLDLNSSQSVPPPTQVQKAEDLASSQPQARQGGLGYMVSNQVSEPAQGESAEVTAPPVQNPPTTSTEDPPGTDEVARLSNVVDLNKLISELSLEGTRSEVAGVAAGPGHYEGNPAASLQLLQACCRRSMPQPADSDYKSDLSHHANRISPLLPSSYPTHRLPQLDDVSFYQKMEQEGLFYAFYFQPQTLQQYCAAKDLKRQAWRYNIEHKAWFQRSGEPKATTKDFEQGSYIYFDKSLSPSSSDNPADVNGWCYRKKDNFTFRYDQLEDELH